MTPEERGLIQEIGLHICDDVLTGELVDVLAYGFFAPLLMMVVQSMVRKQAKKTLSWAMLVATVICFLSMTAFVITVIWSSIILVKVLFNSYSTLQASAIHYNNTIQGPNVAVLWLQYFPPIFNDGIIIWRAWAISGKRPQVLYVSIVTWTCSFAVTLSMCVYLTLHSPEIAEGTTINTVAIGLSMSSNISSMAVNLAGTGLIAYILWNNLRLLMRLGKLKRQFNVWRILLLLFESGAVYAVVQLIFIILAWASSREASFIAYRVYASFYAVISTVYPALTIAIISGPFSMTRVQESVVEVQTLSEANQSV